MELQDRLYAEGVGLYEEGAEAAKTYINSFFRLGAICNKLRKEVYVGGDTVELMPLWQVIAPAGTRGMLEWLSSEYGVPKSSLSSATTVVGFYNGALGWTEEKMAGVGRSKLQVAMEWLRLTYTLRQEPDPTLLRLLEDHETPYEEIERYCIQAKIQLNERAGEIKTARVGSDLTTQPVPQKRYDPHSDSFKDGEPPAKRVEKKQVRVDRTVLPEDQQAALDEVVPEIAADVEPQAEQLAIAALEAGTLAEVIWRILHGSLYSLVLSKLDPVTASAVQEELQERIFDYFNDAKLLPLESWVDGEPMLVGLIMLDPMDVVLQERIAAYIKQRLTVKLAR